MNTIEFLQHAALRLTAARDGETLAQAYLGLVQEVARPRGMALYEAHAAVCVRTGVRSSRPQDVELHRFDADSGTRADVDVSGIARCLATAAPVVLGPGEHAGAARSRVVLPVAGSNNPRRVVVLDDPAPDAQCRVALLQLTELFGNQSWLLDERERDALTGLLNRQALNDRFSSMTARDESGTSAPLWLVLLDLDRFERVNDGHGWTCGDEVLVQVARLLENAFRYTDPVFRFGGDRFVVLLHAASPHVRGTLERLQTQIAGHAFPRVGHITTTIGYVQVAREQGVASALDAAAAALGAARAHGYNSLAAGPHDRRHSEIGIR